MKNPNLPFSKNASARFPKYFRVLRRMLLSEELRTNSEELALKAGVSASQVRLDLLRLGFRGQKGYGYNVKTLYASLCRELGFSDDFSAVIVGDMPAARALARSAVFGTRGLSVKGYFTDAEEPEDGCICPVFAPDELCSFCRDNRIDIAVVSFADVDKAEALADSLADCGIKGIWNLSSDVITTDRIPVKNLVPADSLMELCFELHARAVSEKEE